MNIQILSGGKRHSHMGNITNENMRTNELNMIILLQKCRSFETPKRETNKIASFCIPYKIDERIFQNYWNCLVNKENEKKGDISQA